MSKIYTGYIPPLPSVDTNQPNMSGKTSYNLLPFACVEGWYEKEG